MNDQKTILVLPGMGDIYWVMVKLQSFMLHNNFYNPKIFTWELQPHKKDRSADYIKRIPFVEYGGGVNISQQGSVEFTNIYFNNIWKVDNFKNFDYLLSMNGILRNGNNLNYNDLSQYSTNWFFDLTLSNEEENRRKSYKSFGNYIVAYFTEGEMYTKWLQSLPISLIYILLKNIYDYSGNKIILSGGGWDKTFSDKLMAMDNNNIFINMTGKTSMNELFALIKESNGMIGWCGGNTIMSVRFKKPTIILWSNYFKNSGFFKNSVPPDSLGSWHEFFIVEECHDPNIISKMFLGLINR